jgi:hypothetical protein
MLVVVMWVRLVMADLVFLMPLVWILTLRVLMGVLWVVVTLVELIIHVQR